MRRQNECWFSELGEDLSKATFKGFTLKKKAWYGYDKSGNAIATNMCINKDKEIAFFFESKDHTWAREWKNLEWIKLNICNNDFYILISKLLKTTN